MCSILVSERPFHSYLILWYILGMAKSSLTKNQVEHTARLANLPLTTSEIETFQEQLSEVVEYIQKMPNIKYQISNIRKRQEAGLKNSAREDVTHADKCLTQEDALSGTEKKHNGLFVVPAIFEES